MDGIALQVVGSLVVVIIILLAIPRLFGRAARIRRWLRSVDQSTIRQLATRATSPGRISGIVVPLGGTLIAPLTVARGLAELHTRSANGSRVSSEYKAAEVKKLRARWDKIATSKQVPAQDLKTLSPAIESLVDQFATAEVDASYAHGDAHAGNFSVESEGTGAVTVIDSETLFKSVGESGAPAAPNASDVGRFVESLRTMGTDTGLTPHEIAELQTLFLASYKENYKTYGGRPATGFDVATKFYQANLDTIVLNGEAGNLRSLPPSSAEAQASAKKLANALDALKATLGLPSRLNVEPAAHQSSEPRDEKRCGMNEP